MPRIVGFIFHSAWLKIAARDEERTSLEPSLREDDFLDHVVTPIFNYFFDQMYSGLSGSTPKSRPNARGKTSFETIKHYDDMDEQLLTLKRLGGLVLSSSGEPLIHQPKKDWYDGIKNCDWQTSFRSCKRHTEVHDGRNVFSAYSRHIGIILMIFFYEILVALHSIQAPSSSQPVLWLCPLALNAAVQLMAALFDQQVHKGTAAFDPSRQMLRMIFVTFHVLCVTLVFIGLAYWRTSEGFNPMDTLLGALFMGCALFFSAASMAVTFAFPASASLESGLPVSNIAHESFRTHTSSLLFWILVLSIKGFLDYGYIALPLVSVLVQPLETEKAGPLPAYGIAAKISLSIAAFLSYLASLYLGFCMVASICGYARGFHDLGAMARVKRKFMGKWGADNRFLNRTIQFSGPWARKVAKPLAPSTSYKLKEAANDFGSMSRFEAGWYAVVDDLWGDYLLSESEYVALMAVPKKKNLLYERDMPVSKEAQRRLRHILLLSDMDIPPSTGTMDGPSFTVLIPHYAESIYQSTDSILKSSSENGGAPLINFLSTFFPDEWAKFLLDVESDDAGNQQSDDGSEGAAFAHSTGDKVPLSSELQWRLKRWASRRTQTLYRTISGMEKYRTALVALCGSENPGMTLDEVKAAVNKKFTLLVSMQRLPLFSAEENQCLEYLFVEFPDLTIAYIEETDGQVFWSCLIDANCPREGDSDDGTPTTDVDKGKNKKMSPRIPKFRVRLPGHPILGHGKADNQNHAIIFTRGELLQVRSVLFGADLTFSTFNSPLKFFCMALWGVGGWGGKCIDANQDNYMESALSINCVLSEFNEPHLLKAQIGKRPAILGFSEHIFSGLGTPGEFAATHENVFGTMVQRTLYR